MSLFPILIDLQNVRCLVAGGGAIAFHKAETLCACGADVTVVAPVICSEILDLPVTVYQRTVTAEDVKGQFLTVDATGDADAEIILHDACRKEGTLFNSACRVGDGTAVFPAVIQKGRTMVAVSTLGASPAACIRLRDTLAAHVPDEIDRILDVMAELRPRAKEWFAAQALRKSFFYKCLDSMLESKKPLSQEEIEMIRETVTEENDNTKEIKL